MKYYKLTGNDLSDNQLLDEAAKLLIDGQVVAFPTETVYGLGASAQDDSAIKKIFAAKGRPADNPLIVHVATKVQLKQLTTHIPQYVEKLIDTFSPGPITYVLEHNGTCAKSVTAGLDTIAVRIPNHSVALSLITKSNLAIAAPSANLSGKPSPTEASHVVDDLNGKIAGIVDGGKTGVGVESTVIDCTSNIPIILRHGGITKEQISHVTDVSEIEEIIDTNIKKPKSPGMKYKHYAPDIPLILVKGNVEDIKQVISEKQSKQLKVGLLVTEQNLAKLDANIKISLGETEQEIAQSLYHHLRLLSKKNIDLIVCESFAKRGVGKAIMDRLERAATKII